MRSRAEAATPGPWTNTIGGTSSEVWQHENVGTDLMVCDTRDTYTIYPQDGPGEGAIEDAAHVASWHPTVALAVATWLDLTAAQWSVDELNGIWHTPNDEANYAAALSLAQTYLGASA